jgi:3-phenylpropionate/cinnamic acid dioxygenase small subunit
MNVTPELQWEIERFFYDEASLLDHGRFAEWLTLFTDDVRYWMPVRENLPGSTSGLHDPDIIQVSLIDDDKEFLTKRVDRLATGFAHAETPASRTTHLVGNVRILRADGDDVEVESAFALYQSRLGNVDHAFHGRREDRLRRVDGTWKIAWRKIVLDVSVLPRTLSTFF